MKIYFCGAITGGRQDQPLYADLIAHLKERHGEVLTEHVGDPAITVFDQEGPDDEIYARDLEWLREADAVVAEVTVPSHGVGVELAHAEALQKPVLCLFREQPDRPPSPFIAGNPYFTFKKYRDSTEAKAEIDEFLDSLKDAA
jgi:2'-deoxynucleoside 5'-phosphate N-hydrolase